MSKNSINEDYEDLIKDLDELVAQIQGMEGYIARKFKAPSVPKELSVYRDGIEATATDLQREMLELLPRLLQHQAKYLRQLFKLMDAYARTIDADIATSTQAWTPDVPSNTFTSRKKTTPNKDGSDSSEDVTMLGAAVTMLPSAHPGARYDNQEPDKAHNWTALSKDGDCNPFVIAPSLPPTNSPSTSKWNKTPTGQSTTRRLPVRRRLFQE